MAIVYDKSVVNPPTYLDLDFFQEVTEYAIRHSNPIIERIDMSMGSKTGENYCSFIYRVQIIYKICDDQSSDKNTKLLSLIIKSMPITKSIDFLLDLKVFLKEKVFYSAVLPLLELFLDKQRKFGARLYHCIKYPINTFVFQDLNSLGFRMASREQGFDEDHSVLALKRLAEFHAISLVLNEKDPSMKDCFNTGLLAKETLNREDSSLLKLSKQTLHALIELSRSLTGYEEITQKLEKYLLTIKSRLIESQTPKEGEFQVLNHGDMWVNNMLFTYDEQGQPQDMVFVDYQMTIWGSPGIDLNYFFYTSLPLEMLRSKRDYFISIYHQKLTEMLKHFNYIRIPTLQQIKNEVYQRATFGFFANHSICPIISMDKSLSHDNSFENLANEEFAVQKMRQVFAQPRLKELYAYTLKEFDAMNVFD